MDFTFSEEQTMFRDMVRDFSPEGGSAAGGDAGPGGAPAPGDPAEGGATGYAGHPRSQRSMAAWTWAPSPSPS